MLPLKQITSLLDEKEIKYTIISHSPAFTAQEIAALSFISGKELAKTLILSLNGDLVMAVLPADKRLNLHGLKKKLGVDDIRLATESEFHNIFPECKTGAMPPFGHLYNLKTIVSKDFENQKFIAFNAGNHRQLIRMKFAKYKQLVTPQILDIAIK